MIVLNTRFAVKQSMSRQSFFELLCEWANGLEFCNDVYNELKKFDWNTDTLQVLKDDLSMQILIDNYDDVFGVQITNVDGDDICKTSYILRDKDEQPKLQCIQDKMSTSLRVQNYEKVRLPKLLRFVFWNEFSGDDHGLNIDDKAYILRKNDVDLALNIVNQKIDFDMPIIYVSPNDLNRYAVNYDILASEMLGQAHVVLEGSPVISSMIREKTGETKPHDGAIRVYLPNKQSKLYVPQPKDELDKEIALHFKIINDVRAMQSSVAIPDDFNLDKIKQKNLFAKLSKAGDSELVSVCESLLEDKDSEIKALKEELQSVKRKLASSMSKAENLQTAMQTNDDTGNKSVSLNVTENPFYEGEIETIILRVLQKEYDAMKDDSNLSKSRKFHVLEDVLEHNFPCTTDARLIECIKTALKSGTLNKDGIGRLRDAGFAVEKDGRQSHYKITFHNDDRYSVWYSATPSDVRGHKNFVSDTVNMLFGY